MNKFKVYFGAAGAGAAYVEHSRQNPDFFVDNNPTLWGSKLLGIEIMPPSVLETEKIFEITITSGYVKDILAQLISMGFSEHEINVPPKSTLGKHPFRIIENRLIAAHQLSSVMNAIGHKSPLVAVGGSALGFCRAGDFIEWDFDIDLFAPKRIRDILPNILKKNKFTDICLNEASLECNLLLTEDRSVPVKVDYFDCSLPTIIDTFESYVWEWNIDMFLDCDQVTVHGNKINVPNPFNTYLEGVYGKTWRIPNRNFGYSDYAKK